MQQVFHTWIWGSSAIPPCRSSPVQSWWTTIFRSLQRCSIGFKSGLWLGHSRTVTELLWSHSFVILAVCLGSLSCWKVNLWPNLRSWALWRRFSSRISLYLAAFIFSSIATSRPVPAAEKHPHSMMLHCWDCIGQVMSSAWFSPHIPLRIKAKKFYLGLIRPENLICHHLGVLQVLFSKLHAGFHVSCTEERLPSGHSAIKPRLVEGCSDGWLSTTFSHLPNASLELSHSDLWVLLYLSYQGSSPPIAQFGRTASSRKGSGRPKRLPFKDYGGHCALRNLKCSRNVFVTLARSVPCHNSVSELFRQFLWLHDSHLLWHALWAVRSYIDRCVAFLIKSNQYNQTQLDSNEGNHLKDDQKKWTASELNIWVSQQRVWILRTMWYFSFSFLINLQKCQQFCVFLSIWGAVCTLMRKKMNLNDFSKWLQYNKEWKF